MVVVVVALSDLRKGELLLCSEDEEGNMVGLRGAG
jgi:hypothetical protein